MDGDGFYSLAPLKTQHTDSNYTFLINCWFDPCPRLTANVWWKMSNIIYENEMGEIQTQS